MKQAKGDILSLPPSLGGLFLFVCLLGLVFFLTQYHFLPSPRITLGRSQTFLSSPLSNKEETNQGCWENELNLKLN